MRHLELNPGQEQTIVFLHGGNVAGWMWGEQAPAFGDYHLLLPDFPGFGQSNEEPWQSMTHAADLVAELIAERAKNGVAHVVGLSLGAGVGLRLALRHPLLVRSLLISSTSVTPPTRSTRLLAPVMLAAWNREWLWRGLARAYQLPADSVELFVGTGLGIRQSDARAVYAETSLGFAPAELAALTVPTLAVAGAKDSPAIARDSLAALAAVPSVRTADAPGMHHQWNIENVELFNRMVRDWIQNRTVAAGLSHG